MTCRPHVPYPSPENTPENRRSRVGIWPEELSCEVTKAGRAEKFISAQIQPRALSRFSTLGPLWTTWGGSCKLIFDESFSLRFLTSSLLWTYL